MPDFEALVRQHQGAVCATAFAVLRDRARSEEVAQDAFLVAWRDLPKLSPPPALPGWICGIARNLARNAARKRKESAMSPGIDLASTTTPLDSLLAREVGEIAAGALASLGERDREVLVLYYRGDESLAEVAAILGITEVTARQRLHRGRERLRSAATAVEATLRATRPGTAFTLACIAALAAGRSAPAAAATTKAPWLGVALGAAAITTAVALGITRTREPPATNADVGHAASAAPGPEVASAPAGPPVVRRIAAADRAALLARFHAVLAVPPGSTPVGSAVVPVPHVKVMDFSGDVVLPGAPAAPPPPPPEPAKLSKTTLRYAIRLITPLLLDCFHTRVPGQLEVHLRLASDADSATLVDDVVLAGDSQVLGDAERIACLRETLSSIELPPMVDADAWDIDYPIVFR